MSLDGVMWIPDQWIMDLNKCSVTPMVVVPSVQVYSSWSFDSSPIRVVRKDYRIAISRVIGDLQGNLWAKVVDGWVCILLQGVRQTSWWI
jgi:hypothetical protein